MSLYEAFSTSEELEVGGRWFDINSPNEDKSIPGFLLARRSSNNTEFVAAVARAQRDSATEVANGMLDVQQDKKHMIEIFVDTVLKGWRNVEGRDKKPMAYNRHNAIKLFTDLPDLFSVLMDYSARLKSYQDASLKDAVKN